MNRNVPAVTNRVTISREGQSSAIYMTELSGKIIYRNKIDTIIGIKHPGIVLGKDSWGTTWIIHNHYEIGRPEIVTLDEFTLGSTTFFDNRDVFYDPLTIIDRAIYFWYEKKEYGWLTHNCQH
ncbi:MAG TPA: hypothetical protein VNX68_01055, partial [Nitrosopumilaceae archaeon]|nr:hypothetical protein [Nitrosopumilaceae archaeon]